MLSGTDELKEMLNQDQQLGRRIKPTELRPIAKATDAKTVRSVIKTYSAEIGLQGFTEIDPKFIDRFFVACCYRLGIAIDIIIGAIQQTVLADDAELTDQHFARAFTHIAECETAMNPFLSEDWQQINASILLAREVDRPEDAHGAKKSPRLKKVR